MVCSYWELVNMEGGKYAAYQTRVKFKTVVAFAESKVGVTTDAEEKDYEEYYSTLRIKRLERKERGRF